VSPDTLPEYEKKIKSFYEARACVCERNVPAMSA
jgi:hypothetical protein